VVLGDYLLLLEAQGGVDLLGRQQRVPLTHGPPGVGQHVRPVEQLVAAGVGAQEDLPHGVVTGDGVVVPHRDHQVQTLGPPWIKPALPWFLERTLICKFPVTAI